jgi:hypothetical protein
MIAVRAPVRCVLAMPDVKRERKRRTRRKRELQRRRQRRLKLLA